MSSASNRAARVLHADSKCRGTPLLLDLHLPDIPGVQVLEGLRRESVAYPIVAITGWYEGDDCESAARSLGAAAFKRKPLDVDDMGACLRAVIAASRAPDASPPASARANFVRFGAGPMRTRTVAKEADGLHRLHAQARLGEDHAREQLLAQALPDLEGRLQQRFRGVPRDLVVNAVEDALLDYVSDPSRFDMRRDVPLSAFLLQAAKRNLINSLESERRRHERERRYADDAVAMTARHEPRDVPELWKPTLSPDDVTSDAAERQAFELWRGGERRTEVFARVLGLSDRSPLERRQGVKRFKDRLLKRIRRLFDSTSGTRSR